MMNRLVSRLGVALAVGLPAVSLALSGSARACSFRSNQWVTDPAEVGVDTSPPTKPVAGAAVIKRGVGAGGCGGSASSCDDLGVVRIGLASSDDRTPAEGMGFRLTVSRGRAPEGLVPATDVRTFDGELTLVWLDGSTNDQESIDFDVEIRAVDLGGNVSLETTTVRVQQGGGGCSVGPGSRARDDGASVVVGVAAWALARRRRRA